MHKKNNEDAKEKITDDYSGCEKGTGFIAVFNSGVYQCEKSRTKRKG
jgi:hypothetical protein